MLTQFLRDSACYGKRGLEYAAPDDEDVLRALFTKEGRLMRLIMLVVPFIGACVTDPAFMMTSLLEFATALSG